MNKAFLCLLVATVYTASAVPVEPVSSDNAVPYQRYIEFPDGDEKMHTVDLEDDVDEEVIDDVANDPTKVQYLLFTRHNPTDGQNLIYNDEDSIRQSYFNAKASTVVIVHGWLSNQDSGVNSAIRDAYLGKETSNVIVVDWRTVAVSNYITAARGVPVVGQAVGKFLAFLSKVTGVSYRSIHLVGFSLGAHLVGVAGREVGGKVARITALDPAGPLWHFNSDRISSDDAVYVEAIHTNGGYAIEGLGLGINVGDADFYPNGGIEQPGCYTNTCSHNRAWRFFASTVTRDHLVARRCSNIIQVNLGTCRGERYNMGNSDLTKSGSGVFRVNTRRFYPY
ncbi:pancreatic lipase-related protein 2-like [Anticarsia gemmatalis]|uniref:pancreatic lipase-related protein 2-like n=1 Tax=Anticarsia gemmatalis TaxID=129554 RepID=UPI003F759075